jgi:galactokinase
MRQAHRSMQVDFEASCPELDAMAAAAWATPGVIGARVTGGGFGGACVGLVQREEADRVLTEVIQRYQATSGGRGDAILTAASDGARTVFARIA